MTETADEQHGEVFDAVVIGTGFAGAVTAARLVQAGLRICVLERGRRFEASDFPMYPNSESLLDTDGGEAPLGQPPDLARWMWSVDQGLYDVRDLDDVIAVQAAGYGGGSLIYANVHLRAPREVFEQGWPEVYRDGKLDDYYDRAAYMLNVQPMPKSPRLRKTEQLKNIALDGELRDAVKAIDPPLAVNFVRNDKLDADGADVPGDLEPAWRRPQEICDMRGQCWLGCRKRAKNSLDFNYLAIVEDALDSLTGEPLADIRTLAEVTDIKEIGRTGFADIDGTGARFVVHYQDRLIATTNADRNGEDTKRSCLAKNVFLCAGAVNTTELLMRSNVIAPPVSKTCCDDKGIEDCEACKDRETRLKTWKRLGSRYHPNADSLAAIFDSKEPHHADVGPTITKALLYRRERQVEAEESDDHQADQEPKSRALSVIDFECVETEDGWPGDMLQPGATILCGDVETSLVQPPLFDFGDGSTPNSVGMMVVQGMAPDSQKDRDLYVVKGDTRIRFGKTLGHGRPLEDWFLVEDGGYPTDIEPLLGFMKSPLWMRRNRYIEHEREALAASQEATRFPLLTAMQSLGAVPKQTGKLATVPDDQSPDGAILAGVQPLQASFTQLLPPWLLDALARDRDQFARTLAPMIGPLLEAVLDDVAIRLVDRFDVDAVKQTFQTSIVAGIGDLSRERQVALVRGLLRQGIQVLWGSEIALAEQVNRLLLDSIPSNSTSLAQLLAPLVGWILQYREGNGHTALLLTMGRDQYRGRLSFDRSTDRLKAFLPAPLAPSSRTAQERLLRSIAKRWEGELRTNPAWTALKKRFTVHSQGGCPMHENEEMRVTEETGQVCGCEGLYVMDAAAFPTAVGVNPSATIAAVAEFKVEKFIETFVEAPPASKAPTQHDVRTWLDTIKQRAPDFDLDPLNTPDPWQSQTTPIALPLGLTFKETLSGLFSPPSNCPKGDGGQDRPAVMDWTTLRNVDENRETFELAEHCGVQANRLVTMNLSVTIDDLERFLRVQRRSVAEKVRLTGSVTIDGQRFDVQPEGSYLRFFHAPAMADEHQDRDKDSTRYFRYRLVVRGSGEDGDQRRIIEAAKIVREDSRFDVWQDLATLYVDIFDDGLPGAPLSQRGIMRLAPIDFLEKQLRSITITPADADQARRSWAYAAFVKYYAEELAGIYVSRPDLMKDMLKNVFDPTKGI